MGQDGPPLPAVDLAVGLEGGQPSEPVGIDDAPVAGGLGQQVGAVRRRHRADERQPRSGQMGEVGDRVLPGVEDHRQRGRRGSTPTLGQCGVPGHQQVDHVRELGDVGPVARVGMGDQRHPAVAGDDQTEPDDPQVGSLLFGLAPRGDGRLVVGGVDVGGEVGHVQRQGGDVEPEPFDHGQSDPLLDLGELSQGDRVHRIPEPAMIQRTRHDLGEPVGCGGLPPVGERRFRAGGDDPVEGA